MRLPSIFIMMMLLSYALPVACAYAPDYTLEIFGNANMDGNIDQKDIDYVEGVTKGINPTTNLSDANYDGKVDLQDIDQIEKIISGEEKVLTVIDSAEKIVSVRMPVERIVALPSGTVETMRSLKLESDKIVGINKWNKEDKLYYPVISEMAEDLGSYSSPDYEKLLKLKPDIVIQYSDPKYEEIVNKITETDSNITILRFDCWKPSSYFNEVRKLGYILGKRDEADEFIMFYEGLLNTIMDKVKAIPENDRPTVYFELGDTPYMTTGNKGAWHTTLEMAGGKNLFGDLSESNFNTDAEEVMKRNPDFFLKKEYPEGGYDSDNITEMISERDELLNRTELANVTAVKNGQVYLIDSSVFASPSYVIGIAYMAKWFHSDIFKELDPTAMHKEYLEEYQGIPYRGIYAYPMPD